MENNIDIVGSKNKEKQAMRIILVICLFLCCFVFGIGYASIYIAKSLTKQKEFSTATAQVISTNEAATAQVYTTATALAHSTEIASYEIFDDFDSNPHHWYQDVESNERWNGVISIRDGMYVWDLITIKDPDSFSYRKFDPQKIEQDFDLSVDAKLESGSSEFLCYGIAFRASPRKLDNGSYLFSVCDSGVYSVQYYNKVDGSETVNSWTRSKTIRTGAWNTLSVSANGEHIVLSINNMVVSEFSDAHVAKGYVYLLIQVFDDQPGTIFFDNFALQSR